MNVCYTGPLKDYSGYGEANRHFVAALDAAGITVIPELVSYSSESSDFGSLGARIEPLFANTGKYKIKIMHTTPNEFKRLIEPGVYHIGHFFWETDLAPEPFAEGLKLCDEIWTGSKANAEAIKKAGVDKPIYIFPQPIETEREWPEPYVIKDFDGFLFYSIFEWTDRKNPATLLKAYWEEFQGGENVGLLIKTYFRNFTLANKRMIKHQVERLKQLSGLKEFPPVFLYLDLMDRREVMRLHRTGNVYVSAHRGEGWGVPQVEAALAGRPMISTGWSGCHEYFKNGKTAVLLPYEMTKLSGMHHSDEWYTSEQNWAEVDFKALRAALRDAYDNQPKFVNIAEQARSFAVKRFNLERVGKEMAARLKVIEAQL